MSGDPVRVLVVDDEPAIRRFLHVSLTAHGYLVLEAGDGQAAVAAITAQRPDIVVLDLGLPDLDGVEVTRTVREWTQVPVIILSVRGQEEDKIAALDAGADDYLTKPFGMGELLARMRVALRRAGQVGGEPVFHQDESDSGPCAAAGDRLRARGVADAHRVRLAARSGGPRGAGAHPPPPLARGVGPGL